MNERENECFRAFNPLNTIYFYWLQFLIEITDNYEAKSPELQQKKSFFYLF